MNFYSPVLPPQGPINIAVFEHTLLWRASCSLATQRQVAPEMALATFLGGLSIAAQGLYDVQLPHGVIRPVSLYMCIVSDSGEGKTATENKVMAPIKAFQSRVYAEYEKKIEEFKRDLDEWQLEYEILRNNVKKIISKNGGIATKEKEAVRQHYKNKPKPPIRFRLLYQNTTPEALFQGLHEGVPIAGLAIDEGEIYFKSPMRYARAYLNSLYSGEDVIVTRATKPDITIINARLTAFFMIQTGILYSHIRPEDRESGFWARFTFCVPGQMRGRRVFDINNANIDSVWVDAEERIRTIVEENKKLIDNPNMPRELLKFSSEAIKLWVRLCNEIEAQIQPGGRFEACPDHASKLSDNIARASALIHIFEGCEGDISEQTLRIAIEIFCEFSNHFQKVMIPPPQEVQDAYLLMDWFNEHRGFGNRVVSYNHVRQYGPSILRNKKRLRAAIDVLSINNEIRLFMDGKTRMIDLTPKIPLPGHPVL